MNVQADLNLCLTHMPEGNFAILQLIMDNFKGDNSVKIVFPQKKCLLQRKGFPLKGEQILSFLE